MSSLATTELLNMDDDISTVPVVRRRRRRGYSSLLTTSAVRAVLNRRAYGHRRYRSRIRSYRKYVVRKRPYYRRRFVRRR